MKKVIIIGAGPSGLTAALELARYSEYYEVMVLEAEATVGGIARTVEYHGNYMDLGGHRFFSKNNEVLHWWQSVLPTGQGGLLIRDRVSRILYRHELYDYPVQLTGDILKKLGVKTFVQAAAGYLWACICPKKEDNLGAFYRNRFGEPLYRIFFKDYTEKLCGTDPKEISSEWGRHRVRGLSGRSLLKGKAGEGELLSGAKFYYPLHGPGQMWETAAIQAQKCGVKIRRNCRVTGAKVDWEKKQVLSLTVSADEGCEELKAEYFLSSMPLKDLADSMRDLPEEIREIAAGLSYRAFVSVGILTDRLALKYKEEKTKDCWIYIQDPTLKLGRVQIYNNWSPGLVKNPDTIWIGLEFFCEEGDAFWSLPERECISLAVREAVLAGILDSNCRILDTHRERISKAYPSYYGTYDRLGELRGYLNDISNLICIGRNGRHNYCNMDQCMISAWEAVQKLRQKDDEL